MIAGHVAKNTIEDKFLYIASIFKINIMLNINDVTKIGLNIVHTIATVNSDFIILFYCFT